MCGVPSQLQFYFRKTAGMKPGISFNYDRFDTKQKWQCAAIDSAAAPPRRSWNQEIKSRISSFIPPPCPRHLSHPAAIYPPSSTANSMLRTGELGVMEQAQIKRNASKCSTGRRLLSQTIIYRLGETKRIALIKGACTRRANWRATFRENPWVLLRFLNIYLLRF